MPPLSLRIATWTALGSSWDLLPLSLLRRVRPWIWAAMVALHGRLLALVSFADLTAGMFLLHLFTFDPASVHERLATVEK
ncbi:MAG: hypothetical protein DMG39_20200 [Acidobacteria bacterium]|nr:MAG: hypothetical protein DMG39_20200 [Acidobacteriota bacterium]